MKTLDELDRLHAAAMVGEWVHDERDMWGCVQALASASGILLTVSRAAGGDADQKATAAFIAAAKNAWPSVSARLRAAEAEVERLRGALREACSHLDMAVEASEESGDLDEEEAQEERDFIKGLRAALGEP